MSALKTLDFSQTVERLAAIAQTSSSRTLIALAGVPGSGKSTLAEKLATEVNQRLGSGAMVALGMDGFHLPKAALSRMPNPAEALARRGAAWTFDPAALAAQLTQLRQSAGIRWCGWPDFEHGVGDPVQREAVVDPGTRVILVEGLYLLQQSEDWNPVAQSFDERWFLETPLAVAMERLTLRHMRSWNLSRDSAEARVARNDRLNAEIVLTTRLEADYLIHA